MLQIQQQLSASVDYLVAPKLGQPMVECEDAVFSRYPTGNMVSFCCAISDGASQSPFSKEWAQILVQAFCNCDGQIGTLLQERNILEERWNDAIPLTEDQSWLTKLKVKQGSHATLLGVRFTYDQYAGSWAWRASSIGDSCLFQLRGNSLMRVFPDFSFGDFNSYPDLFSSIASASEAGLLQKLKFSEGSILDGDTVFLLTDSMAQWVIGNRNPALLLEHLKEITPASYRDWMQRFVSKEIIEDDDLTVMRIKF